MRPAATEILRLASAPPSPAPLAPLRRSANCALPPSPPHRCAPGHLLRLGLWSSRGRRWRLGQLLRRFLAIIHLPQSDTYFRKAGDGFIQFARAVEIPLRQIQLAALVRIVILLRLLQFIQRPESVRVGFFLLLTRTKLKAQPLRRL